MAMKAPTYGKKTKKEIYLFKLPWSRFSIYNHPNHLSKPVSSLTRHNCERKITYASTALFEKHHGKKVMWFL